MLARTAPFTLILTASILSSCIELKTTLTVYPNGSGKVEVSVRLNEEMSNTHLMAARTDEARQQAALESICTELRRWTGIAAWAEVRESVADGRVTSSAVGYFDDVRSVGRVMYAGRDRYDWKKNADGGFTLEWTGAGGAGDKEPLFENVTREQGELQTRVMSLILKDARVEVEVVMPGEIREVMNLKISGGRRASIVMTGADVMKVLERFQELRLEYAPRVRDKAMTEEAARAALEDKLRAEFGFGWRATSGRAAASLDLASFEKDLAAAKASYPDSPVAKKLTGSAASNPRSTAGSAAGTAPRSSPGAPSYENTAAKNRVIRDARVILVQSGLPKIILVNMNHSARGTREGRLGLALDPAGTYKPISDRAMEVLFESLESHGVAQIREPWTAADQRLFSGAEVPRLKGFLTVENDGARYKVLCRRPNGPSDTDGVSRYQTFVNLKVAIMNEHLRASLVETPGLPLPATGAPESSKVR